MKDKTANILSLLKSLYQNGGILSLTNMKLGSPFGYLRALENFALLDQNNKCIAVGACQYSQFIYKLIQEIQLKQTTLDEEIQLAVNDRTVWPHYLYNVKIMHNDRPDLISINYNK